MNVLIIIIPCFYCHFFNRYFLGLDNHLVLFSVGPPTLLLHISSEKIISTQFCWAGIISKCIHELHLETIFLRKWIHSFLLCLFPWDVGAKFRASAKFLRRSVRLIDIFSLSLWNFLARNGSFHLVFRYAWVLGIYIKCHNNHMLQRRRKIPWKSLKSSRFRKCAKMVFTNKHHEICAACQDVWSTSNIS